MSRRSNDVILFHNPIALASCISLLNCPVCGCATLYALEGRQVGRWRFVDEVFAIAHGLACSLPTISTRSKDFILSGLSYRLFRPKTNWPIFLTTGISIPIYMVFCGPVSLIRV